MGSENKPSPERHADKAPTLDIGVGDPEAPANAIPNIIADLVETESWRDAATILMGVLLIGLGFWAYYGIRDSGAVGYFLLTGKPIFPGDDNLEISNQVLHTPAPSVPEALDALIAACLEKERSRRPQTMEIVVLALDRVSTGLAWTQQDAAAWWKSYRDVASRNR
jgi:serine/threonine protein kinase